MPPSIIVLMDSQSTVLVPLMGHGQCIKEYAIIDSSDADKLGNYRWSIFDNHGTCYAVRRDGKTRARIFMHREILGLPRGKSPEIDHINRNGLDNRRANLRIVTTAQNQQNRSAHTDNQSGYRGVFHDWRNSSKPWIAKAVLNDHKFYLGSFESAEEAGSVARAWRLAHMPFATD